MHRISADIKNKKTAVTDCVAHAHTSGEKTVSELFFIIFDVKIVLSKFNTIYHDYNIRVISVTC